MYENAAGERVSLYVTREKNRAETGFRSLVEGDTRAFYLPLPDTTADTVGSRQHPGVLSHRAAAEVLTAFLKHKLEEQA